MPFRTVLVFSLLLGTLAAQSPGGYPRNSSQLPFPIPGRKSKDSKGKVDEKTPLLQMAGVIKSVSAESLVIDADDTRIVTFKLSKDTAYRKFDGTLAKGDLKAGDEVSVEARKDDEGFFHAATITLTKAAAPKVEAPKPAAKVEAPKETAEEPEPPKLLKQPERAADDIPPRLKRGKPEARPKTEVEEEPTPVAAPKDTATPALLASANRSRDPFIEKTREVADTFTETLPNYFCRQSTTRFQSETRQPSFTPLDVVTLDVVYENGKENYRNIRVNNKPLKKGETEPGGSWSTGEFASTLADLFSGATRADFVRRGDSTASGRPASLYNFTVLQPNSHWRVTQAGQTAFPGYRGSVWIDKATNRVMRIEMQSSSLPSEFPIDKVEWVVDYEFVRLGTNQFLLPVHAENLACFRGGWTCVKNVVDFRNYRKFAAESQLSTVDSNLIVDGPDAPQAAPPAASKKK